MQKSLLTLILAAICSITVKSQVTIGSSENPAAGALLQLKEISGVSDDGPDAYGGLAMPRVNLTVVDKLYPMFLSDKTNASSGPDANYVTNEAALNKSHTGLLVYNSNGASPFKKGIYVWTGARWEPTGSNAIAENGLTASGNMILLGGALTQSTTVTLGANNLNFDATGTGKVGIGNTPSSNSAILEVNATDKGVLLPKVALTGTTDNTTISTPAVGLLVYNTGANPLYTRQGYMFWNGTEWRTIDNEPAVAPVISTIYCGSASLSPSEYTLNIPYNGTMKIPYSGGNGAKYTTGQAVKVNGLTFQLQDGKLENGNGDLLFKVSGTPTVSSPTVTSISISSATVPFYTGGSCTASVGDQISSEILTLAVLSPLKQTSDNGVSGWATAITTPDGYFSVRVFVPNGTNMQDADLQIRNNRGSNITIMWSSAYAWHDGSSGASNNRLALNSGVWSGNDGDRGTGAIRVTSTPNAAWGNADVYYDSDPEQRSYMWTTTDTNDQTAYMMTFMMGATNTGTVDATKAASSKAFFKIDQIRAR
ncbi:hypothetical protein AGMMS49574_28320 [Bacteroidia bacterium]|nr:hypothetical protein AGMMS49574_28320 [Bacteroidia bacterium]